MSTPDTAWHLDEATLARYARGETTAAVAASAEAHLTACAHCRALLAPAVPAARLDGIWDSVEAQVDHASLPLLERLLLRAGLSETSARLLAATPSLSTAWLGAIAAASVFASVAASSSRDGLLAYLALAPMLPVAGVAAAYGRLADPAYELSIASPYSMLRLLLLRSVAVVGTTLVLTGLAGLLLAGDGWQAAAWLLPALALSVVTLALSARVAPVWAATGVLGGWVTALALAYAADSPMAVFGVYGQAAAAALLLAGALVLVAERDVFAFSRRSA